jgi:succinate-acetate transporter protein
MWYLVLIFILLVLIFAIIGGLMEIRTREKYGEAAGTALFFGNFYGMLTMTVILVSLHVINSKLTPKEPEAIDVYRNNTELKIQHVIENCDTISCDTTVVWKEYGK